MQAVCRAITVIAVGLMCLFPPLAEMPFQSVGHAAATRCDLTSSGLTFANYVFTSRVPTDAVGTIQVRCEGVYSPEPFTIELSRGGRGGFIPRTFTAVGEDLQYNLYLDPARTIVWGDGTVGTSVLTAQPVSGQQQSFPIFGRIFPNQNVPPGTYRDVILVTLQF